MGVLTLERPVRPRNVRGTKDDPLWRPEEMIFNEIDALQGRWRKPPPFPDIIEFAEDSRFLSIGKPLYPRQQTWLKLVFLQTETMTDYDYEVIGEWAESFWHGNERIGVQPDIWDRVKWLQDEGYDHFPEVLFIGGRRGSKNFLGAITTAYRMWRLLCFKGGPQREYGIDPNQDLIALCVATNFVQARDQQYNDILDVITDAPCFRPYHSTLKAHYLSLKTPSDRAREQILEREGVYTNRDLATLRCGAITSNAAAGRGVAAFMEIFDEAAHMLSGTAGPRTFEEIFQALQPALDQCHRVLPDGRVVPDGMTYMPTSPYQKLGMAYLLYEEALKIDLDTGEAVNKDMLLVQLASWDIYKDWEKGPELIQRELKVPPQVFDERLLRVESRNKSKFTVERRAQWAEVEDAYFDPDMVEQMFEPFCTICGHTQAGRERDSDGSNETCWYCGEVPVKVRAPAEQRVGILMYRYRGHADPGATGHNFALVIAHAEPFLQMTYSQEDPDSPPVKEVAYHVMVDYMKVWKPEDYPTHQIPYDEVDVDIAIILNRFPTCEIFTYDQPGNFGLMSHTKRRLQRLRHGARVRIRPHTVEEKAKRPEAVKSALGMNWLHSYRDDFYGDKQASLLESEMKYLREKNGKVMKQDTGPVTTDDLWTAFSVVVYELLKDQIERLDRRDLLGSATIAPGAPGGYHTGRGDPDLASMSTRGVGGGAMSEARRRLSEHSRRTGMLGQRGYGGYGGQYGRAQIRSELAERLRR